MFAFSLTIFWGAFLLFLVQPLIARFILPWFGGGPAVWTTCMLFFQLLLLGGYAQFVGQIVPSPDGLADTVGLQGLAGDVYLVGQVDHIRLPALLQEFLRVGLEFGFHLGGR